MLGIARYSGTFDEIPNRRGKVFSAVVTVTGDIIYSVTAGLAFIVYLYYTNDLIFRWYIVLSAAAGFASYYLTVGKLMMMLFEWLDGVVKKAALRMWELFKKPVAAVICMTKAAFVLLWNTTGGKLISSVKRRRGIKRTEKCKKELEKLMKVEI